MREAGGLDLRNSLLIGVVLVGVVGSQLCVKAGISRAGSAGLAGGAWLPALLRLGREPLVWAGLALTAIAALTWLAVLSRMSLSTAYPFLSLSYVIMMFAAHWIFHDSLGWPRLLGAALICAGLVLVARQN